jgi:Rrf2 family protein
MERPSKKLVLTLTAVTDIAYHGGAEPVQSQDIARRLSLPRRYLEQVMQQLVRAGILRGVRGPRGGYRLARERRRVSVGDVVRVVRGIEDIAQQDDLGPGRKSNSGGITGRLAKLHLPRFTSTPSGTHSSNRWPTADDTT